MVTALRVLLCALLLSVTGVVARQVDHLHEFSEPEPDAGTSKRTSLITFADPRAQAFQVDGTKIPEGEIHTLALRLLRG